MESGWGTLSDLEGWICRIEIGSGDAKRLLLWVADPGVAEADNEERAGMGPGAVRLLFTKSDGEAAQLSWGETCRCAA